MSSPDPPKVTSNRQADYDDMMLRLGIKNKMKEAVESGQTFEEACDLVGVPYEYVFSASQTDDDFREIWQTAQKQEGSQDTLPCPSTVWRDGHEVKAEFMNMLVEVGLFNKLVEMASMADPGTEEGNKVLMFFGRSIIPQILPKQEKQEVPLIELKQKSDKELMDMLKSLRKDRLNLDG